MTKQDAQRIAEHCQAQVASDQFTPRLEAAYDVIANVPEYQNMTGVLIGLHGIKFASPTDTVIVSARTLAQLMLTALACGFAFGEDWGEGKTLESTLAGKGNEERDWEIHDADDIERLLNLLKVSVVDRRRMGWE